VKHLLIFLMVILGFDFSASAAQGSCLDQARVDAIWKDFTWLQKKESVLAFADKVDACDRSSNATKLIEAFILMQDWVSTPKKGDIFDQGILNEPYYEYFKARVRAIKLHDNQDTCGTAASFSTGTGTPTVTICPSLTTESNYKMLVALMHEARHADVGQHERCSSGFNFLETACDFSYESKGSYAVSAEVAVRISRDSSLPKVVREQARKQAIETFTVRFNRLSFEMRQGIVLYDLNDEVYFYDGKTLEKHLHLKSNSQAANIDGYLHGEAYQKISAVDYLQWNGMACSISKKLSALCINQGSYNQTLLSNLILPTSKLAWIHVHGADGRYNKRMAVIVSADQDLLLFPKTGNEAPLQTPETIKNPSNFKDALVFNSDLSYGLTERGLVQTFETWGAKAQTVPALKNMRFKRMLGPIYSSKVLDNL
jgi:hypothetical protein